MQSHEPISHPLISIRDSADVAEAARLMSDCSMGAIGVLGPDKRFIGIFTERDLMWVVAERKDPASVPLTEVMNDFPVVVDGPLTREQAVERMQEAHVRHLIVRESEDLRIISMRDVLSGATDERQLRVVDVMTAPAVACRTDAYFEEIADVFSEQEISGMPVLDEEDRLVGVLSERDLAHALGGPLVRLAVRRQHHGPFMRELKDMPRESRRASEIMSSPPVTVHPDTDLASVAAVLVAHKINRVPVVDGDRLIGVVSRGDVLAAVGHLERRRLASFDAPVVVVGHPDAGQPSPFAGLVS